MIFRCRFPIASCAGKFWAVAGLLVALFPHTALSQSWPTKEWEPACSGYYGSGVCDLEDVGVEIFLLQLEESSGRFEAMGFPAPALDTLGTSPDAYPVYFFEEDLTLPPGKSFAGFYDVLNRRIDLDYTEYFAMNTRGFGNMYAPTHELFHAIQYSYPEMLRLRALGNWVLEGTAIAAELFLFGGVEHRVGLPWLDTPLDAFGSSVSKAYWHYVSYPFWLHVVDAYGGGGPDGFGVLHDFLADIENQAGQSSAIAMVDGALRTIDAEGLYNIYPGFIARHDDQQHYESVVPFRTRPTAQPRYTTTIKVSVDPVSARAFLVQVVGIIEQEQSGASEVEIRLEADDPDALHLIVGDTRYDEPGAGRNVYFADIGGEALSELTTYEELFVRVVNVARDPAAYQPQDFELIATVYHEYNLVQGMGQPPGEAEPGGEAIGSAITTLDRMSGFLSPYGSPYTSPDAGFAAPCHLRISFLDDGRKPSAISFMMDHEGPIVPGTYPIVSNPDGVRPENYPDQVIAGFVLGASNPLAGGIPQAYEAAGGVLTLSSVTPRWITGNARILGSLARKVYTSGGTPPDGPNPLAIDVEFSVRNHQVAHMGAERCAAFDGQAFAP